MKAPTNPAALPPRNLGAAPGGTGNHQLPTSSELALIAAAIGARDGKVNDGLLQQSLELYLRCATFLQDIRQVRATDQEQRDSDAQLRLIKAATGKAWNAKQCPELTVTFSFYTEHPADAFSRLGNDGQNETISETSGALSTWRSLTKAVARLHALGFLNWPRLLSAKIHGGDGSVVRDNTLNGYDLRELNDARVRELATTKLHRQRGITGVVVASYTEPTTNTLRTLNIDLPREPNQGTERAKSGTGTRKNGTKPKSSPSPAAASPGETKLWARSPKKRPRD